MLKRCLKRLGSLRTALSALVLCLALPLLGKTPVEEHGLLKISNGKLCSASGTPVQLKGMSWFWSQWSTAWWTPSTLNNAVDQYGITLARLAMGTPSNGVDLAAEKARVISVVEAARAKGIYVIIDWHSHAAESYTDQAKAFFVEMATKYKNVPNVMFEIYNEPLNTTSWSTIRAYAETVGWAIRATGAENVVIVGTKTWSQDVDEASANPVTFSNAAYTLHFYADTHRLDSGFRQKVDTALSRGCAIVVTEWGTDNNLAQGPVNEVETRKWMTYLDEKGISWANWSLFDKDTDGETASFFKGGTSPTGPWTDANLSTSGRLVKQFFTVPDVKLSANPSTINLSYAGGSSSSALTAKVGWTAVADQAWFSVTPTSGSTNATLTITAQPNTGTAARSGKITLTGNEGSSTTITVHQAYNDGNLAVGKPTTASSVESASYPAAYATDGDLNTRWASAASDPQWIMVDLGTPTTLSGVGLVWEAAYAKTYQIQISTDGATWTSVYSTSNGAGGTETLPVSGTGRYVRLYATARATAYGNSLFEFKVFGSTANTLQLSASAVSLAQAGGSASLGVTSNQSWKVTNTASWLTVSPASGSGNGTLSLQAAANTSTSDRSATVTVSGGGITASATVTQPGQGGTSNIALGKTISTSSTEGASLAAANAVDGSSTSRWASAFADPQWITVDLGATYQINKVVLVWEAAYAKSYQIQVSADNSTFTPIYSTSAGAGGTETLSVTGTGRYIRMYGTARATAYGYSLWEFQVYGTPTNTQTLSVSPASVTLSSAAGTSSLALTSNVAWSASSSQSWLTLSPASGSGNGTLNLSASANTGASRSATITVAGPAGSGLVQTVTVTQSGQSTFSVKVEAEDFIESAGVQKEACSDTGGGLNVGYIDQGDWMTYSLTVPTNGSYTIQYRVASPNSGKSLSSDLSAGAIQLGSVAIPNTGTWQAWTTVSQTVELSAGTHAFGINGGTGGFNVNWFTVTYNGN